MFPNSDSQPFFVPNSDTPAQNKQKMLFSTKTLYFTVPVQNKRKVLLAVF
jgi:hypothetical protein